MGDTHGFFWNSVGKDRIYDADSFENWLKKFYTTGVFVDDLQVTVSDALKVSVSAGYCNVDGKVQMFSDATELAIATGNSTYPRIDNIVVERNDSDRDITLKVVQGTSTSTTAVAPTRTWTSAVKQLVLAQVSVPAGATSITAENITDTRANKSLCGIVAGTVDQIDFEHVDDQFQAWFANLKNQLDGNQASNLQNQIDTINSGLATLQSGISVDSSKNTTFAGQVKGMTLAGNLTVNGQTQMPAIELSGTQPYIDFHYGSSKADYTSRIIEQSSGTLVDYGNLTITGDLNVKGKIYFNDKTQPPRSDGRLYFYWDGTHVCVTIDNKVTQQLAYN